MRTFPLFLICGVLFLNLHSAHALFGNPVAEGGPEAVCSVVGQMPMGYGDHPDLTTVTYCTGTLVSETEVRTAAHCIRSFYGEAVPAGSVVRVSCGKVRGQSQFREVRYAKRLQIAVRGLDAMDNDAGAVILDRPITNIRPIPLAGDSVALDLTDSKSSECFTSGFGMTSFSSGLKLKTGPLGTGIFNRVSEAHRIELNTITPVGASIKSGSLLLSIGTRLSKSDPLYFINEDQITPQRHAILDDILRRNFPELTMMQEGDSGGPLYCRSDSFSPFLLVGINEGMNTTFVAKNPELNRVDSLTRAFNWAYANVKLQTVKTYR